jgi:hypothetical protein
VQDASTLPQVLGEELLEVGEQARPWPANRERTVDTTQRRIPPSLYRSGTRVG